MTFIALVSSLVIGIASLAWGFFDEGWGGFARWVILLGVLWLVAVWQRWRWFPSLGLFFAVLAAGIGFWFEVNSYWMMAGAIFVLFAWDMTELHHKLRFMADDDDVRGIERRHIARVSLLSLAGIALTTIALVIQVRFTFEWGVLLVALALLGLAQLIGWFRRR